MQFDDLDKKMSAILGVNPSVNPKPPSSQGNLILHKPLKTPETGDHKEDDYSLARDTLRGIVESSTVVLDDLAKIARESEHPRAYEVLATLMKTMAETSKDLLELQKRKKDLSVAASEGSKPIDETTINVERAVFVGTTAELLKQIKQKKEESE